MIAKFTKHITPNIYVNYKKFMYTGTNKILMDVNHKLLERGISPENNEFVLEVGGGAYPHLEWADLTQCKQYVLNDTSEVLKSMTIDTKYKNIVKVYPFSDTSLITYCEGKVTRIIASHVLEHLDDPEQVILDWCKLLRPNGILSIAIPCDPGWFWSFCRDISAKKATRVYGISQLERELIMTREHINSTQRILGILKFYFKKMQIRWFPSLLPIVDFNLLCIINVNIDDFM